MSKKTRFIIIVGILLLAAVGCGKEDTYKENINTPVSKYENPHTEEIIKMSRELNTAMFSIPNIKELTQKFDNYVDRMSETVYLNYFDTKEIDVALMYYMADGVYHYTELETVTVERNKSGILTTDVYVIFTIELDLESDNPETSDGGIQINGVNKYTYSGDKLVGFTRVQDY